MADGSPQYQINEQLTGIRFYNGTPIIGISAALTIESNVTAVGGPFRTSPPATLSASSDVSGTVRKVIDASASLSSSTVVLSGSVEILKFIAYLSGEETTTATAKKISKSASFLASSTNISATGKSVRFSKSSISGASTTLSGAKRITSASANLTSLLSINITDPFIINNLGLTSLSLQSSLLIADLIRFTPNSRYPGSILTMFLLDGQPLTSQGRTFSDSIKQIYTEKKNWNNTKSRYYKRNTAGKLEFKLSWDWLPADRQFTIDKRFARNFIKEKAMDPDVHILTIILYGENSEDIFDKTDYNVFITGYNEDLLRRDLQSGTYLWKCDLDLMEA